MDALLPNKALESGAARPRTGLPGRRLATASRHPRKPATQRRRWAANCADK